MESSQFFFLPPNVSSLLQPMDQGINECIKQLYRKKLLQKLLLADESEECHGVLQMK
jgi:hypothetical protein